jgi:hypothetical protein
MLEVFRFSVHVSEEPSSFLMVIRGYSQLSLSELKAEGSSDGEPERDQAVVHHGVRERAFIQKPFTLEGLSRKVREVLDKV